MVYSQSETGRQTVLHREDTLHKLDISWHRPICGLFPAECQLECQSFRLCYLQNVFPVFAVMFDEWQQAQPPKCWKASVSWPSIYRYLVLRKRDEKHSWTRLHEENLSSGVRNCGLVLTGHGVYTDRFTQDGNRRSLYRSLSASNPWLPARFLFLHINRDISQLMKNG